jgi:hypothetical protein
MKILKYMAILLVVSYGQSTLGFGACGSVNLDGMSRSINTSSMCQLEKNREQLKKYQDCVVREQQKTAETWRHNQDRIIALRNAEMGKLAEQVKAHQAKFNYEKSEIDLAQPLRAKSIMQPIER